jgi:aminoglycoside phosphotransferase (APT) family kinase protein
MTKPTFDFVIRLVANAFPLRTVTYFEELPGGLCNTNLKVNFGSHERPVVLRLYQRDKTACGKETELLRRVRPSVPVPEVYYVNYEGDETCGPFAVLEYISGITFQQLRRMGHREAIKQASYSAGKILAAIGQFEFSRSGRLDAQLMVGDPYIDGPDCLPKLLNGLLSSETLERRTGTELVATVRDLIWSHAERLREFEAESERNRRLVHSDFGSCNILVREFKGKWAVAAVLDWEFAFSGSPLVDVGHFLRYEQRDAPLREPEFSRGFLEHGGELPDDWPQVVKLFDLTALCDMLTRETLPDDVVAEQIELVRSTVEEVPLRIGDQPFDFRKGK